MTKKIGIITGNGQDSSYLAKLLLEKDYQVIIATRRSGSSNNWRLKELDIDDHKNLKMVWCDITEFHAVCDLIKKHKPDELYNLAAQSFVQSSFNLPFATTNVNYIGHLNILEAVRYYNPSTKIYFAATSEMFGEVQEIPQTETTPFYPRSPYGISKLASYWLGVNYRESYDMFVSNGLLFNHESGLRGAEFVTRKITKKAVEINEAINNKEDFTPLVLGNLDALRDWGHAEDFVYAMWLMLQQDTPDDFVIATGVCYSIQDFVDMSFHNLHIDLEWKGKEINKKAYYCDKIMVEVSEEFYRPTEVKLLQGDARKAKEVLGWELKHDIISLVNEMIGADIHRFTNKV